MKNNSNGNGNNKRTTFKTFKTIKPLRPKKSFNSDEKDHQNRPEQYKRTIRLPTNHRSRIKAAIIGKGGSQIKLIYEVSECKVSVEESRVVIYGSSEFQVNLALDIVQSIINNALCVFEHPSVICTIYEMEEDCRMKLIKYETTGGTHHQQYYRLDRVNDRDVFLIKATSTTSTPPQNVQSSETMETQKKKLVQSYHHLYSQKKEKQLISEGLASAISNFVKLDQYEGMERKLLIKIGLGKKVYYDSNRKMDMCIDKEYSFDTFSKLDIGFGRDIKSSFRLEMGEEFALKLKQYLLNNNWELKTTIKSATCYVVKLMEGIMGSSGGKRLSFKIVPGYTNMNMMTGSSACRIGKIKNAMDKICHLDFCNLEDSCKHPDLRLRFETEQFSRESTDEQFNNFISLLKFNDQQLVDISNVPQQLLDIFRIDSIRNKTKEVYCCSNGLKITINKIRSKGNEWYEISMSTLQPYTELTSSEELLSMLGSMRSLLDGVNNNGGCTTTNNSRIVDNIIVDNNELISNTDTATTIGNSSLISIHQTTRTESQPKATTNNTSGIVEQQSSPTTDGGKVLDRPLLHKVVDKETNSSYWPVLAAAVLCTAVVGFGLNRIVHK